MNKPIKYITKTAIFSFVLTFLLIISNACTKKTDITNLEGQSKESSVIVNANFTSFSDEIEISNKKASVNKHESSPIIDTTIVLNDKFLLKAEMSTDYESKINLSQGITKQNGIKASNSPVDNNVWYRLIVFNKASGDYVTERLYQRGSETNTSVTPVLILNTGITYTFVAYSINNSIQSDLPLVGGPSSGKTIANTFIDITNGNTDILFTKIDKAISGQATEYLNLVFKRKSSQVTLTIDAQATGYVIETVNSKLTARNTQTRLSFLNESLTRTSNNEDIPLFFPNLGTSMTATSNPVVVNSGTITGANYFLTISSLKIGEIAINSAISTFNNVNLSPAGSYILKLTVIPNDEYISNYGGYGVDVARINGLVWMRHNLRADGIYSANPDIPGPAIFGHYYQWGRKTPVSTNPQLLAQHENWIVKENTYANSWNGNTSNNVTIRENSPSKATDSNSPTYGITGDPCPNGYRIPTHRELQNIADPLITKATFDGDLTSSTSNNNGIAVLTSLRNANVKLTFPTQGTLWAVIGNNQFAEINNKGSRARTWSSYYTIENSYRTSHINLFAPPNYLVAVGIRDASSINTSIALPIRCIAIDSNIP